VDQPQQRIDQRIGGQVRVLHHAGERRTTHAGGRDIVKSDHGNVLGHRDPMFLQGTHCADGDQVAGGEDRIKARFPGHQLQCRGVAGVLGDHRIHLQRRLHCQSCGPQRLLIATIALEELRIGMGGVAQERDVAAPVPDQMLRGIASAQEIVAADRDSGLPSLHRAPAYEVRALARQALEP